MSKSHAEKEKHKQKRGNRYVCHLHQHNYTAPQDGQSEQATTTAAAAAATATMGGQRFQRRVKRKTSLSQPFDKLEGNNNTNTNHGPQLTFTTVL